MENKNVRVLRNQVYGHVPMRIGKQTTDNIQSLEEIDVVVVEKEKTVIENTGYIVNFSDGSQMKIARGYKEQVTSDKIIEQEGDFFNVYDTIIDKYPLRSIIPIEEEIKKVDKEYYIKEDGTKLRHVYGGVFCIDWVEKRCF